MSWAIETITAADGAPIRTGIIEAVAPIRATCLLLPGLGDFLEKRAPVAADLAANGHRVISLDWRGQGGSGRYGRHASAAHADGFDLLSEDAILVLDRFKAVDRPVWFLGYSMGGTIALPLAIRFRPQALALVSPMLALPLPERAVDILALLANVLGLGRGFAAGEAKRDMMGAAAGEVSDPVARVWLRELHQAHPDLAITGTTWGWIRAAIAGMRRARMIRSQDIGCPVLVAVAEDEKSVCPAPIRDLATRLDACLIEADGGHDLFLARPASRERLMKDIRAFADRAMETTLKNEREFITNPTDPAGGAPRT